MTRNLDIGLLRAFAAVAERGSMTAAARALNLTQGAVSQQIARLEALAGAPLLDRGRPGLGLTASGERLLGQPRRLVSLNDEVWSDLDGGTLAGPVRLGVPYDLVGTRFAPVLKAFAARCPQVELSLSCAASAELSRDLRAGRLDLAVVEQPIGDETGEPLAVDRLVWVGARGGDAHRKAPLPVSMVADVCAFKPAVLQALAGRAGGWRTMFENGSLEATFATVRADLAVSAWLASTCCRPTPACRLCPPSRSGCIVRIGPRRPPRPNWRATSATGFGEGGAAWNHGCRFSTILILSGSRRLRVEGRRRLPRRSGEVARPSTRAHRALLRMRRGAQRDVCHIVGAAPIPVPLASS